MFKPYNREQDFLLPPSLKELIPDNDLVYVVAEVVDCLDLEPLIQRYDPLGQHAYHPKMLLAVLFYAYAQGILSSRKIAERLRRDVHYMYLTGMQTPDFRTISDFRKDHIDLLKYYFVAIVKLCKELGIVAMRFVAIDGTKIHASASSKQTRDRDELSKQLSDVETRIAELLEYAQRVDQEDSDDTTSSSLADFQLKDLQQLRERLKAAQAKLESEPKQRRINMTDLECRDQSSIGPGWNCQIAVDAEQQIIIAADVFSDPADAHLLLPMIEQAEANTDSQGHPKQIVADSGYETGATLKELNETKHIEAYIASQRQDLRPSSHQPPFDKSGFQCDLNTENCICPQGFPMRVKSRDIYNGVPSVRFAGTECRRCPVRSQCTPERYRTIRFTEAEPALAEMRAKMETPHAKAVMSRRKHTVEPVIGWLKEHLGFRRFKLRGKAKVRGEFSLLCTALNLKRMHTLLNGRKLSEVIALMPIAASKSQFFVFRLLKCANILFQRSMIPLNDNLVIIGVDNFDFYSRRQV